MNDVSVICVSRCEITCGTLSGNHVLTLIRLIMTGHSFKIVSNWAVLTVVSRASDPMGIKRLARPPPLMNQCCCTSSIWWSDETLRSIGSGVGDAEVLERARVVGEGQRQRRRHCCSKKSKQDEVARPGHGHC